MTENRSWAAYPPTYRSKELKTLANWISLGESSSVVGLPGCGRSNLLGFMCNRPRVLQSYLPGRSRPVALIPVDLNNLPANNLATLYRVILRAFYRVGQQFDLSLRQNISTLYQEHKTTQDPFLVQTALQELLLECQAQRTQVVLVLNRFDRFCQMASRQMVNTLRGLRDEFKDTLCYIAGMSQEVIYLPEPAALGHMYELLDNYVCRVGAMTNDDAQNLIDRATAAAPEAPTPAQVTTLLKLTGGYPALLRAVCHWWLTTAAKPPLDRWQRPLLAEGSIQHRLKKMWEGLTQEEQFILSELQQRQTAGGALGGVSTEKTGESFANSHRELLSRLAGKGVCRPSEGGWQVNGDLLSAYVATVEGRGRGRIWLNKTTGELYQGDTLLKDLTALEQSVLAYLIKNPRIKHTKTELIINTWPDDLRRQGVSDNSLYQVILAIRKAIEPTPSQPAYLITWRGKPEGGYQFFPEGRPK